VAVAVVIGRRRRWLIAERPAGEHLSGTWEFPSAPLRAWAQPASGIKRQAG
jgi:hypothetical protein